MRREAVIPGFSGKYKLVIDDDDLNAYNAETGKPLSKVIGKKELFVQWRFFKGEYQKGYRADTIIEQTFPGISRREYIPKLYKGIPTKSLGKARHFKMGNGILLENLYTPVSYCLTTPIGINYKQEIKRLFPGPLIEIENDGETEKRELYFTSNLHLAVVLEIIKEMLEENLTFSK